MDNVNKPLAAEGLISYRIRGTYGYIMIGARDNEDAWSEAKRSASNLNRSDLEVWNGQTYINIETTKPATATTMVGDKCNEEEPYTS